MKVALCFNINYKNILVKEKLWKEWIYYNRDIIHVYFHYKKNVPIKSPWVAKHCIPRKFIRETSYFHVVPALMTLLSYAYKDNENKWFCLLTDSCVPIISPEEFRKLFFQHSSETIFHWYFPNWNIQYHKRANLYKLPRQLHLANDPWFVMTRLDVFYCLKFITDKKALYNTISQGIIANESIFAIILFCYNRILNVINEHSSICDWTRKTSPTSPYVFRLENAESDKEIITKASKNKYSIFLRKIHYSFPDSIIENIIFPFNRTKYTEYQLSSVLYRPKTNWWPFIAIAGICLIICFSISI